MTNFKLFGREFLFILLGLTFTAYAVEGYEGEDGFVAAEGGLGMLMGKDRDRFEDPVLLYLNLGFSLSREFHLADDFEPLRIGPKIGIGFGTPKGSGTTELFYDALVKIRYTFFPNAPVTPYVDLGPGLYTFQQKTFELEGGAGFEVALSSGTLGVNAQYKEFFGTRAYDRQIVMLAALGYRF